MKMKHLYSSFNIVTAFLEKRNVYSATYDVAGLMSTKTRQFKLRHHPEIHTPPCINTDPKTPNIVTPESIEVLNETLQEMNSVYPHDLPVEGCMDIDNEGPHINNENPLTFLFFLGVQGKEYIENIIQKFPPSYHELVVFTSLNIDKDLKLSGIHVNITSDRQCVSLTSHLKVLDPLGGGSYPLDFLFIIDRNNHIICSVPLIMTNRYPTSRGNNGGGISRHLGFSLEIPQLDGFIDEYIQYFSAIS